MRAIFIREIQRFLSPRLLLLILGCILFSLAERKGYSQSYDNFVLSMLVEHYYITFFMTPVFLYILYAHVEEDLDYVLIRIKNYPRYFGINTAAMTVNVSFFVLLQLAVFIIVGIGLPSGSDFPLPDSQQSSLSVLWFLSDYFQYPWQAAAVSVVHMIIGLIVLSFCFMTLHHFSERRTVAIITITLYFLMVYGMKSKHPELTRIPFIFINNYILFFYNLTYPYALWISYISLAIMAGGSAFLIIKYWHTRPQSNWGTLLPRGFSAYLGAQLFSRKNIASLLVSIIVFSLWKLLQIRALPESTMTDYMIFMFWGHGHGYFEPKDFISMIIMNSLPIYLLALFLENEKKDHSMMLTVRLRSKWLWGASIFRMSSLFLIMYTLLLTSGTLLVASTSGLPAGEGQLIPGLSMGTAEIYLYLLVAKLLELLFQFLFLFVIYLWSRQATAAMVGILILYGLYLLPYPWLQYIPVGMSSLVQRSEFGTAMDSSAPGLSGSFILLYLGSLVITSSLYVLLAGYKKRFR
ncbi:hypothetical protein [Paenibacillus solani]|uniref:Permease n=1 Tax=Paenibacillus solani TaxID=1705565 RepID=A0A0M1P6Y8_9BACL|nr:hypothetical protein [Paenibacillus solani]KOR90172.1 hypothetical protein AM231_14195 [Paenibacillus solani]